MEENITAFFDHHPRSDERSRRGTGLKSHNLTEENGSNETFQACSTKKNQLEQQILVLEEKLKHEKCRNSNLRKRLGEVVDLPPTCEQVASECECEEGFAGPTCSSCAVESGYWGYPHCLHSQGKLNK